MTKKYKLIYISIIFLGGIILSCNMPLPGNKLPEKQIKTAQAIITEEIEPLKSAIPAQVITQAANDLSGAASSLAQTAQAQIPQISTPAEVEEGKTAEPESGGEGTVAPITHTLKPGEPGKAVQTLVDFNSQTFAGQKRTDGDYYLNNLLERPFDAQMTYHGNVDLQKAEIFTDVNFYYFTLYLAGLDPKVNDTVYAVELDTDIDGRGDYLLWVVNPKTTTWETNNVALYADADGDVGGKTPLQSDAPSSGTGYEKIVTSPQSMEDPDAIWSRKSPNNPNAVQIAVKIASINKPSSFMWGAWADGLLKSPNLFDYNDVFTVQNAGTPLKDDKFYPLKSVNTIDNTCRGLYGRAATGLEPGLCSDISQKLKTLTPIEIPKITPPSEIRIP
jgi:hypothetical protein